MITASYRRRCRSGLYFSLALLAALLAPAFGGPATQAQTGTLVTGTFQTQERKTPSTAGLKVLATIGATPVYGSFDAVATDTAGNRLREITCGGITYVPQNVRGWIKADGTLMNSSETAGVILTPTIGCSPTGLAYRTTISLNGDAATNGGRLKPVSIVQDKAIPDQASVDWASLSAASISTPAEAYQKQVGGLVSGEETWAEKAAASIPTPAANNRNLFVDVGGVLKRKNPDATVTIIEGAGGSNHAILSATHTDSLAAPVVLGDVIHGNATPAWARLAGNITATKQFLSQTGTGTVSAAPVWAQPAFADLSGTATDAQLASNYSGIGGCTNQFARTLNDNAAPTCATVTSLDIDSSVASRIGAQTLQNKTLDATNFFSSFYEIAEQAAPGNAVAGFLRTFGKTVTKRLCTKDNVGVEVCMNVLADADVPDTITLTNLTQITTRNYSDLQGIPSTFAPAPHALVGADHTASALAIGAVLRATSATAFAFGAVDLADTDAVTGLLPDANIAASIARDAEINVQGTASEIISSGSGVAPVLSLDATVAQTDVAKTFTTLQTFNPGTTPAQAFFLSIAAPGVAGTRDSHFFDQRGASFDTVGHTTDWRRRVNVTSNAGASTLILESRIDAAAFATRLSLTDAGVLNVASYQQAGAALNFSHLAGTATDAQLASNYSGIGGCTNQFARTLNDNAAPTCATVAAADVAADLATQAELDTHAAATATHGATGAIVGTTNTQTLQNKTLDGLLATTTHAANANFIGLLRHATDCTAITDGISGEACYEQDANAIFVCEPTAGGCDTPAEWINTTPSGGGITSLGGQTGATQTFANDTNVTMSSATNTHTLGWTGTLAVARGGTGQSTQTAAFNALDPLTTLGDTLHHDGTNSVRLAGNITTTKQFLSQTGTGAVSAAPAWAQPAFADLSGTASDAQLANNYSGIGGCTNQFARALNDNAAPTCATVADADVVDTITAANYLLLAGGTLTGTVTLRAGAAGAGTAPAKFQAGAVNTTAEAHAFEWDGTNLFVTQATGPTRKTLLYTDGNAATATALAANPTDCAANQFANAIAASGNLTCAAIVDADVPDTITASNYLPLAGGTLTGKLVTIASAAGGAGLNLPAGAAPTSPVIGDIWNTGLTLQFRDNAGTPATRTLVDATRLISTTAPLGGGGDLSADRTLTCTTCTTNAAALTVDQVVVGAAGNAVKILAAGGAANVLTMSGGIPVWSAPGGGTSHAILSATHTDSLAAAVVLGDTMHGNATPAWARLAGNITTTKQFLNQTGTGAISAVPVWSALVDADVPDTITLTNLTQITTRAISDTTGTLLEPRGGTGESTYTLGDLLYSDAANSLAKLAGNITTAKQFLTQTGTGAVSAAPAWAAIVDADVPNTITIDLAATATALAANPTDCAANQFAISIVASGNLTCAAIADADIPAAIMRDAELAAFTVTKTNLTLDVEATGNVVTTVSYVSFLAATCQNATATLNFDTPTTSPAVAACITGTNTQKGVADFADAANLSMQTTFPLPRDWTGTVDARFKWLTTAIANSVVWQLSTICVADAETDDPAFNTASTVTDAAKGTANQTNDADIVGVTMTGCAAGELLHLKVQRDSAHASDTLAATARLISLELTLRRAQ